MKAWTDHRQRRPARSTEGFYTALILQRESFHQNLFSAAGLLLHFFLHALSFQFELPKRIWTKPMIWREFRVHNAIFAFRHLIGTAIGVWAPEWWWQSPTPLSLAVKVVFVFAVSKAADVTTDVLGSTEDRTTNSMPYPKNTPVRLQQLAKRFYAKAQFGATTLAVFGTPSVSFAPIFAIEIASFLMTLVRKGIVEARTYHICYALSLFMVFPVLAATLHSGKEGAVPAVLRGLFACGIAIEMRMKYRVNKYLVWAVAIVAGSVLGEIASTFDYGKWVCAWAGLIFFFAEELFVPPRAVEGNSGDAGKSAGQGSTDGILNESPVATQSDEGLDGSSPTKAGKVN